MSCVSAADNQTDMVAEENDITTQEILTEENDMTTQEILADENDKATHEILTDDNPSPGNFSDLNYLIVQKLPLGSLKLDRDYVYNPTDDVAHVNGIKFVLVGMRTIDGDGHTIDGAGLARIFDIDSGPITLKNINFINGKNQDTSQAAFGGAIFSGTNRQLKLTIINCNFTNNQASSGGAIYAYSVSMENCNFINNTATHASGFAGAVHVESVSDIKNCNFTGNKANRYSGALSALDNIEIENCNFYNNLAKTYGGAISNPGLYSAANKTIIIKNSKFINNTATNNYDADGGAITIKGKNSLILINCTFDNNKADQFGGAIYSDNFTEITDSIFTKDQAASGGAVYTKEAVINNSTFTNNKATSDSGGAIFIKNNGTITHSAFTGNNADSYAGAVYFMGDNNAGSSIDYCQFYNNYANTGGAIVNAKLLILENSIFDLNTAASAPSSNIYTTPTGELITHNITPEDLIMADFSTLQREVAAAENYLKLTKNYIYDSINDGNYRMGVPITKENFTIDGDGHTINGNKLARIFDVKAKNVTLMNINFINGEGYYHTDQNALGGTVFFRQNGTVINCNFVNNTGTGDGYARLGGGAITFKGYGVVKNSNFTSNTAVAFDGPLGGAIAIYDGGFIDNCNFIANNAYDGGAISVVWWVHHDTIIKNSNFINHTSNTIYAYYNAKIYIDNCNFTNNKHQYHQVIDISEGRVSNCTFNNNLAGDGIIRGANQVDVIDCTFNNNTATDQGGAIYTRSGNVINCTFNNNTAEYGGAIYIENKANITGSTFNSNIARARGGAVYVLKNVTIENSIFNNNHAIQEGGAVYIEGNSTIKNSQFTNNEGRGSSSSGGAVYAINATVENSNFTNNIAISNGGALSIENNGTVKNCTFTNNLVRSNNGGAIYLNNGTVETSKFKNNVAITNGGAVCIVNNATVKNCTFTNNQVRSNHGGAVYANNTASIVNSQFTENIAASNGGALYINKGSVINSTFNENILTSGNYGGAIFLNNATVVNSNFTNNKGNEDGGAIHISTYGIVENSIFTNNTARSHGGAIYAVKGIVKNSIFNNNSVTGYGGAVYFATESTVQNSAFNNNNAIVSGGIFFEDKGTVENSNFTNNNASSPAGALYFASNGIVKNSQFTKNNALKAVGGAIYAISENLTIENSDFNNNKASNDGGAIYATGNLTVKYSNFNNNSGTNGGAIRTNNGNIIDCNFTNNTATATGAGGAIYANSAEIDNCDFNQNTGPIGGAVFITSNGKIKNSDFTNNSAKSGGAIHSSGMSEIGNSTFNENHADHGGAINANSNIVIGDSEFNDNTATDGTNHLSLNNNAQVTLTRVTPDPITPYRVATLEITDYTKMEEYGQTITITISAYYEHYKINEGIVYVTVNNVNYTANVNDGVATISIPDLLPGTYSVDVKYISDSKEFTEPTQKVTFRIIPTKSSLNVTISNVTYGEPVEINAEIINNGTTLNSGEIYVIINNTSGRSNLVNNTAKITIPGLDAGTYEAKIFYFNENYNTEPLMVNFTVYKASTNLEILADEHIKLGEEASVIVGMDSVLAKGNITLYIDGDEYNTYIIDDYATVSITIPDLTRGTHIIGAEYNGNDNFNATEIVTTQITVDKASSSVTIEPIENVTYPNEVYIQYDVENKTTVRIKIYNETGSEITPVIKDEDGIITIEGLVPGIYYITISNDESDDYEGNSSYAEFKVNKADSAITIEPIANVTYGNNVVINYNIENKTTVTVIIYNETSEIEYTTITNSSILISNLKPGKYTIWMGNEDSDLYNGASIEANFTVDLANSTVTLTQPIEDIDYGENLTVYYKVGNQTTISVFIINNVTGEETRITENVFDDHVVITDLSAGKYGIFIINEASDLYKASYVLEHFNVEMVSSEVTINPIDDVVVGNEVVITYVIVNQTDFGELSITDSQGNSYDRVVDEETGTVTATLPVGRYIVRIHNSESNNYYESEAMAAFNVIKAEPTIEIEIPEEIKVGEDFNVKVTIENATGTVTAFINGEAISQMDYTLDDGVAVIPVPSDLVDVGTHTFTVNYNGDENHTESINSIVFTASKNDISEDVKLNITVPEGTVNPEFNISLPEDATGYLLVDINGEHYYAPIENGTAKIVVPNLAPGNYTANVTYTGDDKYESVSNSTTVSIPSNVPENAITIPENITSETDPTFSINLPADAGGYLEVDVDGTKYVVPVKNGTANITVPKLPAGDHNITVTYTGDGKYAAASQSTTLSVKETVVKFTNNRTVNVVYSGKATYKVRLLLDGKAAAGKTVTINFNGRNYKVKTNSKGYAILNLNTKVKPKTYNVTATYKNVSVTSKVNVKHMIKASNKNAKKSRKLKLIVKTNKVNGKYLKGKKLKLKFKGKTYTAKINKKGKATFTIKSSVMKKLKAGKKYKYTVSYGKDKVTKKIKIRR